MSYVWVGIFSMTVCSTFLDVVSFGFEVVLGGELGCQ